MPRLSRSSTRNSRSFTRGNRRQSDVAPLPWVCGCRRSARRDDACRDVGLQLELIGVLRDAGAERRAVAIVVEHDDTKIAAIAAVVRRRLVDERILQHGIQFLAVRCDSETFVASVVLTACCLAAERRQQRGRAGIADGDVVHGSARFRHEVRGRFEHVHEPALPVELVERGTVFIRHEEMAGSRIDHQTFRIEARAQESGVAGQPEGIQAVKTDRPEPGSSRPSGSVNLMVSRILNWLMRPVTGCTFRSMRCSRVS